MTELVERRQYGRVHLSSHRGYAVVKRGWLPFPVMGNIIDISMGGLSFRYVGRGKPRYKPSHLEIWLTDGSLYLDSVRVATFRWDCEVESERSLGFTTRQCGVAFGNLTDDHQWTLRQFVRSQATADNDTSDPSECCLPPSLRQLMKLLLSNKMDDR